MNATCLSKKNNGTAYIQEQCHVSLCRGGLAECSRETTARQATLGSKSIKVIQLKPRQVQFLPPLFSKQPSPALDVSAADTSASVQIARLSPAKAKGFCCYLSIIHHNTVYSLRSGKVRSAV